MLSFGATLLIFLGVILLSYIILIVFFANSFYMYKQYKRTYKELPNLKFVKNLTHVYDSEDRGFVWFTEDDGFKLIDCFEVYLHNNTMLKAFDPYGEYWRRRYVKWFKENVNVDELDIYGSPKQPVSKEEYDSIMKYIIKHLR